MVGCGLVHSRAPSGPQLMQLSTDSDGGLARAIAMRDSVRSFDHCRRGVMGLFRDHRRLPGAAVLVGLGVGAMLMSACGSASTSSPGTTAPTSGTLTILVTSDDGVGAPGINAAVQGLRTLPNTRVTVVAPLTNQSGTGEKTTPATSGPLVTSKARTASGYAAVAVHG